MTTEHPELPPGLVAVPLAKSCTLVLTTDEYLRAIRRGKYFLRRMALAKRLTPNAVGAHSKAWTDGRTWNVGQRSDPISSLGTENRPVCRNSLLTAWGSEISYLVSCDSDR